MQQLGLSLIEVYNSVQKISTRVRGTSKEKCINKVRVRVRFRLGFGLGLRLGLQKIKL